jgi:ectoine hydroxylase
MRLSDEQVKAYDSEGFLLLPECFSQAEVDLLRGQLAAEYKVDSERRVLEKGGYAVRSVYGSHVANETFGRLVRLPRLLEPARQLLGGDVYVHQFKINAKVAFGGDVWQWHQDFVFWLEEDNIPEPRLVNVVIFLDEANEFNGPMLMVNGSHREGVLSARSLDDVPDGYTESPAWISNLTADLKYTVRPEVVGEMVRRGSMSSARGPAGSVLFFHPNLLHGSSPNMSPFDRSLLIVTYNSVENLPGPVETRRPWFLVSQDYTPLSPVADDGLAPEEAARGRSLQVTALK